LSNRETNRQCNLIIIYFNFFLRWLYPNLKICSKPRDFFIVLISRFLILKLVIFISNLTWFKLIKIRMYCIAQRGKMLNDTRTHRLKPRNVTFYHVYLNKLHRTGKWSSIHEKRTKKYVLLRIKSNGSEAEMVKSVNLDTCRIQFICVRPMYGVIKYVTLLDALL